MRRLPRSSRQSLQATAVEVPWQRQLCQRQLLRQLRQLHLLQLLSQLLQQLRLL